MKNIIGFIFGIVLVSGCATPQYYCEKDDNYKSYPSMEACLSDMRQKIDEIDRRSAMSIIENNNRIYNNQSNSYRSPTNYTVQNYGNSTTVTDQSGNSRTCTRYGNQVSCY